MEVNRFAKGNFIVFEGLDGCGKSTQIKLLYRFLKKVILKDKKINVKVFREPGGTYLGEKMRYELKRQPFSPQIQLLLFNSCRALLLEKIKKFNKHVILLDRYIYSTHAYQGLKIQKKDILHIEKLVEPIKPDIVFLFTHKKRTDIQDLLEIKDDSVILERFLEQVKENWILVPDMNIKNTFNFLLDSILKMIN